MSKRILSIILALCLCLFVLPGAQAYWPQALQVCAGNGMSAAVLSDHSLWAWGVWYGNGSYGDTKHPVKIMEGVQPRPNRS